MTFTNTGDLPLDSVVISDTFASNATFIAEDSSDDAIYIEGERNVYFWIPEVSRAKPSFATSRFACGPRTSPGARCTNAVRVISPYYITQAHYQTTTIEKADKCGAYNGALVMDEVADWHDPICAGWNQRYSLSFRNTSNSSVSNVRLGEPTARRRRAAAGYVHRGRRV